MNSHTGNAQKSDPKPELGADQFETELRIGENAHSGYLENSFNAINRSNLTLSKPESSGVHSRQSFTQNDFAMRARVEIGN